MRTLILIAVVLLITWIFNCVSLLGQTLNVPANFPKYDVTVNNSPGDGYFFLSAYQMPDKKPGYLLMIDNYGTPVYYRYFNNVLNCFSLQPNGLLSFMKRGTNVMFYMMDSTFSIVDSLNTKPPYTKTNPHDFVAMKNGHFLFFANDARIMDMSSYGGKTNATVTGCVIQEQDENKNVVFTWNTWDHFQISDSYADLTVSSVDLIHHNSIDVDEDGNIYLISRSLNEVTKIDRQTGNIIWRLGGKNNQFKFVDTTSMFSMPHDFRKLPNGNFTIFDNGNDRNFPYSRALEYSIDQVNKVVNLVWNYDADKKIYADNSGSTTKLISGNAVICYGNGIINPALLEVHPDSSIAFRLEFEKYSSPRAYKSQWRTILFEPITYSIDFGKWDGYTTSEYLLVMKNNSDRALTLTSYSTHTDAFGIDNSFPVDIPANGQLILTVTYYPSDINTGVIKDVLTINSDINSDTLVQRIAQQIELSGTKDDFAAPVATIPLSDKENIPGDTVIYITFSEPVRKPDNTEFDYSNIDPLVVLKKNNVNGEIVPFDAVIDTDKKRITITPTAELNHTQTYYVAITNEYEDYSNNKGILVSATFRTVDLTGPVLIITPLNNANYIATTSPVYIHFDEPVRNIDNSEITINDLASIITFKIGDAGGTDILFSATINAEKTIITIVPDQLAKYTTYYVAIGADVEDYYNNPAEQASSIFTTGGSTGLEDTDKDILKIYPNPGYGLFRLEFSSLVKKEIKVTNLSGRTIFTNNVVLDESFQLDLSNNHEGIYFLQIKEVDTGTIHTYKLIIQNGGK